MSQAKESKALAKVKIVLAYVQIVGNLSVTLLLDYGPLFEGVMSISKFSTLICLS